MSAAASYDPADDSPLVDAAPDVEETADEPTLRLVDTPVAVRRAPRYRTFILSGVIVGLAVAGILSFGLPSDSDSGQWLTFGYLSLLFGVIFALLGGLIAVLTDRKPVRP